MSNHLSKLLYRVFKAYGIPVTCHTIEQTVLTHPEYPAMQSVSDAFDLWKIKHIVAKFTIEKLKREIV